MSQVRSLERTHLQVKPCAPFDKHTLVSPPSSPRWPPVDSRQTTVLSSASASLNFLDFTCKWVNTVFLCVWFISYSTTFSRFIHVVEDWKKKKNPFSWPNSISQYISYCLCLLVHQQTLNCFCTVDILLPNSKIIWIVFFSSFDLNLSCCCCYCC